MNNLERQRLYQDYKEMKQSYQNVVEANTKLVNENQYLTLDKEILQQRIDKAIACLEEQKVFNDIEFARLFDKYEKELLDILKGSGKDGFYN